MPKIPTKYSLADLKTYASSLGPEVASSLEAFCDVLSPWRYQPREGEKNMASALTESVDPTMALIKACWDVSDFPSAQTNQFCGCFFATHCLGA